MPDVLKNPRVREILDSLRQTDEVVAQIDQPDDLLATRDRLFAELGEAVYTFARTYGDGMVPVDDGTGLSMTYTEEVPEEEEELGWYPADVPTDAGALFAPGDIEDGTTDIPESSGLVTAAPDGFDFDEDYEIENVARMRFRCDDPDNPMGQLQADPAPTWLHHVEELVSLLDQPPEADDADGLAVEASRVQWAAGELEPRLAVMPAEIQICFLGLLAARAQLLREHLDVGVGPRLALDRLDRYRLNNDLPSVAGLQASPRPEYGTWANDAKQWYSLLAPPAE